MSVVNLVTLLVNATRVAHGAWGMGDAGAPVLVAVGVQVMEMGAGATVLMGKDLLVVAAYHLVVVAATAGHLHIVMLVVIHLMPMEIKAGPALCKSGMISREKIIVSAAKTGALDTVSVMACLKQHPFASLLHLSAHGFLTIASLHHLFYSSWLLNILDDHLSYGLSAKLQRPIPPLYILIVVCVKSLVLVAVQQKTVLDTFNFISSPPSHHLVINLDSSVTSLVDRDEPVSQVYILTEWIELCFLYLGLCYLAGLINIILTVNAASTIYAAQKPISFRDLTRQNPRLKGPFITSIYVLLLSTCILTGFVGVVSNWYILSKGFVENYYYYYSYHFYETNDYIVESLITIFHVTVFIALLIKYSEWGAGWNMALVISILEETYGIEAFQLSAYFGRGSTQGGLRLMLVFTVWENVLRLPCLFGKCSERAGGMLFIYGSTSLICMGNLMKWVVLVVYFFRCKKRILDKKVDEEVGRKDVGVMDVQLLQTP
ncbi:hypothetical protein V6N13_090379 [Hibiscus sabdariffa]|uniref:Uncharacterized protein n=1 Tax=Hibiscus sabdariffa TaxID=183260 RepID=A0ABR1Z7D5_9ROSI